MSILLIAGYMLLFSFVIWRSNMFSLQAAGKKFLVLVFLMKCFGGLLYTWVHIKKYGGGDTLNYFNDGNIMFQSLYDDPLVFLRLVFGSNNVEIPDNIRNYVFAMGFWGDTSAYMVVRFNALVRLFSFGNFYVHAVFMAFVSFVGLCFLHRAVRNVLGDKCNSFVKIIIFLIPSVLFWTSGVHKEGLLLFALGVFFYCITGVGEKSKRVLCLVGILISAALIFLLRDFALLLLLPGFLAYLVSAKAQRYSLPIFISVYIVMAVAGSFLPVFDGKDYLDMIAKEQHDYVTSGKGKSDIHITDFEPTLSGLFSQLPESCKNVFLGIYFVKPLSGFNILAGLENSALLILFFLSLVLLFQKQKERNLSPLLLWFFFFAFTWCLLIGLVVPNVGAMVRYRSLALPFLFLLLAANISLRNFRLNNRDA